MIKDNICVLCRSSIHIGTLLNWPAASREKRISSSESVPGPGQKQAGSPCAGDCDTLRDGSQESLMRAMRLSKSTWGNGDASDRLNYKTETVLISKSDKPLLWL